MIRAICLLLFPILFFSACSSKVPTVESRIQTAFSYADKNNLKYEIIHTNNFDLFSLQNKNLFCENLNVYIEGDGLSFLNKNRISPNPTPVNSTILNLLSFDKSSCKVYIARPCQYYTSSSCNTSFWTNKRFSPEVINSFNEAMDYLKVKYKNNSFTLIGHSGGGAVATILSSYRSDVKYLVTIAGNLDIEKWVQLKRLTPLYGSLNPKNFTNDLKNLKQYHLVGKDDEVLPKELFFSYLNSFEDKSNVGYKIINANHNCCFEKDFQNIINSQK